MGAAAELVRVILTARPAVADLVIVEHPELVAVRVAFADVSFAYQPGLAGAARSISFTVDVSVRPSPWLGTGVEEPAPAR